MSRAPNLVWAGALGYDKQEFHHGVLDVWLLTRPGRPVPDVDLPVRVVPERILATVEATDRRDPCDPPITPPMSLSLTGTNPHPGTFCVGSGGRLYVYANWIGGQKQLARVDLDARRVEILEDDDPDERNIVREAPNGLILTASGYGDFAMFEPDGTLRYYLNQGVAERTGSPLERPPSDRAFWDQSDGAEDISCGTDTFIVLHDVSRARGAEVASNLDRYTYDGRFVRELRFEYGSPPVGKPMIGFACLDRHDRIWAASPHGTIWLFSPEGEELCRTHLRELPAGPVSLKAIEWFGVDRHCRLWVYGRPAEGSSSGGNFAGMGFDLGLD